MDSGACGAHMWGFPKIRGTFFGVPMRTKAFLKPMLGSSYLGKLPCVLVKVGVPAGVNECRVLASPEYWHPWHGKLHFPNRNLYFRGIPKFCRATAGK